MAKIYYSDTIRPSYRGRGVGISIINNDTGEREELSEMGRLWVYNILDCCGTYEVDDEIRKIETPQSQRIYKFDMAMQGPALAMMFRGIRVDMEYRDQLLSDLYTKMDKLEGLVARYADAVWSQPLNIRSPEQLKHFFYDWPGRNNEKFPPGLGLGPKYNKVKGRASSISTNQKALERCRAESLVATPVVNAIFAWKDYKALLKVVESGIDSDGRMRFSFNVGATETGRWSSSKNCYGTGTNGQNITPEVRRLFIPDPGKKLAYLDLEQAESRTVAYLSGDENYIEACNSGDLHTVVARMIWPDLAWTGDLEHDKHVIAGQTFYRHFSYRDMSKRCGHAANYLASSFQLARTLGIPQRLAEEFLDAYLDQRFTGIKRWHSDVAEALSASGVLETPLGFRRTFFGRLNDDNTLKEAIAFVPQSTIAYILNIGLYRVWRALEIEEKKIEVLSQQHDAVKFQFDVEDKEYVLGRARELMEFPVHVNGRNMVIPVEAKVGWNWRDLHAPGSAKDLQATEDHFRRLQGRPERATPVVAESFLTQKV